MENFIVKSIIHDYEVKFINNTRETILQHIEEGDCLIIDKNIVRIYSDQFAGLLMDHRSIIIDATETQKSYEGVVPIIQNLIENDFKKNNKLFAIGGGITQDITAFISSILFRGICWYFFPTTLLSQGDSCIGSKTSINFRSYKNQIGGFYPPNKIFIDLGFLDSLDSIQKNSGMGEMCHYFIISGYEDFFRFKNEYLSALNDKKILQGILLRSLEIKKRYIEIDEHDTQERQILNYGHSFGHALESLTNFRIPHGIAVSFGMDIANFISVKMGYIPDTIRNEILEVLHHVWDGYSIRNLSLEDFIHALSKDKKNVGKQLGLVLNKGYGNLSKEFLTIDSNFLSYLDEYFSTEWD